MARKRTNKPVYHVRTREEKINEFYEQLDALEGFCEQYDAGKVYYAKYIASTLYVLFYKASNANPLTFQLNIRAKVKYPSSFTPYPKSVQVIPYLPLIVSELGMGVNRSVPWCHLLEWDDSFRMLPFRRWWSEVIYRNEGTLSLSREQLVNAMRSKDGGGHFDEALDNEAYHRMKTNPHEGWRAECGGVEQPIDDTHHATMRQIGWEAMQSLSKLGAGWLQKQDTPEDQ